MEGLCLDSEDVKRFFVYKVTNNLATQKATKNMPADPKMRCIHCGGALQSILGKRKENFSRTAFLNGESVGTFKIIFKNILVWNFLSVFKFLNFFKAIFQNFLVLYFCRFLR